MAPEEKAAAQTGGLLRRFRPGHLAGESGEDRGPGEVRAATTGGRGAEPPDDYLSKRWLADHLAAERRDADLLSEVREAIFGAQDGVTSILVVVITVATATTHHKADQRVYHDGVHPSALTLPLPL